MPRLTRTVGIRLSAHLHLPNDDPRFAWTARKCGRWKPPVGRDKRSHAGCEIIQIGRCFTFGRAIYCCLVALASGLAIDSPMPDSEQHIPPAPRFPWDFHPASTAERLRICGRLLANARRDAVAMAAYEMGDDSWSVGCRAYAFGKQRLKRAASSRVHTWLSVMDDSHHFVFLIEKVPVRFYRGFAQEPTVRTLRRQEAEAQQLGLALGIDEADGLVFRFAIETGVTGNVERVVFLA